MCNVLLVIDLQQQFSCSESEKVIDYCKNHVCPYDKVIFTVFHNTPDSNFVKHLGWKECLNTSKDDLLLSEKGSFIEIKNGYAFKDIAQYCTTEDTIDIVGGDADACILATAFDLWDKGYNFHILTEYIYTTATDFTKEDVIKLMKRNFGDCIKE